MCSFVEQQTYLVVSQKNKVLGSESFTRWLAGSERVGAKGKSGCKWARVGTSRHEGKNGHNRHKGCKQM